MRKLFFGITALAVAVALVASASARPGKHEKSLSGGTNGPGGGPTDLTRPAGLIESTSFEAADGFVAGTELCGGPANGFCTVAPPFADQCPAAGTNCCAADPHPPSNWFRSGTDQHCNQPHIETANPSHLTQHLRFVNDPTGGNPSGCAGFTVTCRSTAFTPLQVAPTATVTLDFDIAGGPVGGSQTRFFCADDSHVGTPNVFMGFYFTGSIVVYDYTNLAYVYHPWDTSGAYGHVNVLYDTCGDVIEYRYNGTLFHSGPMLAEGFAPAVDRCIWDNDNGIGTWDVDNYVVTRTICPSVCDGVAVEPGEVCDGDAPGGACPPGRCNATCDGCIPICTLAAPCPLANGANGPFIAPCDPGFGCIFSYTADTEVVSIDTCGSSFDTQILYWGSETDPGDPGSGNDDCCNPANAACGSFGNGSDPSASCYSAMGFDLDSCTCHDNPMAGDNAYFAQITQSGPSLPPNGGSISIFIDKKLACNTEWDNGACCDTNSVTGGDPAGCEDDVAQADCMGPDDVWTFNKLCSTVTCDCVPDCTGAECGDDGCGGSCGTCDDSNACTTDACVGRTCEETPIVCNDGNACTNDSCNPASGCTTTPRPCDDGNFCNGPEGCDPASGCTPGTPPCDPASQICDEATDTCEDAAIPTVSEWGLVMMALLLLAGAKVYFGRRNAIA